MHRRTAASLLLVAGLAVAPATGPASPSSPATAPATQASPAPPAGVAAPPDAPRDGELTLEALYHPQHRVDFSGDPLRGLEWLDDERYTRPAPSGGPPSVVDARSGEARPLVESDALVRAFAALPGFDEADARKVARLGGQHDAGGGSPFRLDPTGARLLVETAADLFVYDLEEERAIRLTHGPEAEVGAEFSPDGRLVAFVRDHDLHVVGVDGGGQRPLTVDGDEELLYGRLDWVYQEELYGRGNFKGYWWSPGSDRIAFLRLDESPVQDFVVVDHLANPVETEVTAYPKAGTPNPRVALGVVDVAGGEITWADHGRYEPIDHLIVRVGWTPDGDRLVAQVQDREQTWLDLNLVDPGTGTVRTLFRETTPAFVQVTGEPLWLPDGTFLWLSERTGYRHLYRYSRDGELLGAVTEGEWEVRQLHGVDAEARVHFSATAHRPVGLQVYRVELDGSGMTRLSEGHGTHQADFNPATTLWIDTWSDVRTPPRVRLHDADGREVRAIDDNRDAVERLAELDLGTVEFLQVPARDGFPMEAMMIRPPDFDPGRTYPLLQYNYGGPHAPVVRDAWGGTRYLWHHLLAQRGVVVWMCDNRSASGKGIAPTWEAYRRLGVVELRDIEDGLDRLAERSWVDPSRIGIWGWSYGGFMTAYALTHSDRFALGIAGAPVTDWRLYDTIYTERYMAMPQNNPEGYDATSVVGAAADLSGDLLIVHGTMDDNVHLQNTLQLVHALETAGREFDLLLYPDTRHRVEDPALQYHLYRRLTRFVLDNL